MPSLHALALPRPLLRLSSLLLALLPVQAAAQTTTTVGGFTLVDEPVPTALGRGPTGLELRVNGNLFQCFAADGTQVGVDVRDQRRAAAALPLMDASGFFVFGDFDLSSVGRATVPVSRFDCATGFDALRDANIALDIDVQGGRHPICQLPSDSVPMVFDADDRPVFSDGVHLCAFNEATETFQILLDDARFDATLGPGLAETLALEARPPLEGDPNYSWAIRGVVRVPDRSLWVLLTLNYVGNQDVAATTVLRMAPDGTLSMVGGRGDGNGLTTLGRTFNSASWLWFDADSGVVLAGLFAGGYTAIDEYRFVAAWDPTEPEVSAIFITGADSTPTETGPATATRSGSSRRIPPTGPRPR